MRLRTALALVAAVLLPSAAALASGPETLPAWYKISRTVNWSPDPCSPTKTGEYGGQILVTFPYDAGADMIESTDGDNKFDCYGLDSGTLPDTPTLRTLTEVKACDASRKPPSLLDFCAGGNVIDPVTGFRVHYFNLAEAPGNQYFILSTSSSGYKGSLGTRRSDDGTETERSTTSPPPTKNAGYDFCRDIGYDGKVVGKCGPAFAPTGSLTNQSGGQTALSDYRNATICPGPDCKKTILFTLSAEWCPPCQLEASHAEGLYQSYASRGHQSLELLMENNASQSAELDPGLPLRWATRWNPQLTFPVVGDFQRRTWGLYNVGGFLPSHVMLDDSGKIFWRDPGYSYDGVNPCTCPFTSSPNQSVDCQMRCLIESRL